MLDLREVLSVNGSLRHHREHFARLQVSGKPVVLTAKGKSAVVMRDARSYQALLDQIESARDRRVEVKISTPDERCDPRCAARSAGPRSIYSERATDA